jgi:L-ascorbate metabolism protein UlaG (beta-lactamase superfamily)
MSFAPVLSGKDLIRDIDACELRDGQCAYWWLGQHSFVIKLGRTICYIDPYLSPSKARRVPPLVEPEQVSNASAILGTHDHSDHIDRPIWPRLAAASPNAVFVAPQLIRDQLVRELGLAEERIRGIDDGVTLTLGDVRITAIPAAHELLHRDPATGLHPFLGLVFEGNGVSVYHAGDTCIYEGIWSKLRRWKRIDLALLPINGRDAQRLSRNCIGNMTFQEAADLAGAMGFGLSIPAHWEMFAGNSEDPSRFIDYMKIKYPQLRAQIPVHGQRVIVERTA